MPDAQQPEWMKLYHAALVEVDRAKLSARIEEATAAIRSRLRELDHAGSANERMGLEDALYALRALQSGLK
jgi:hypothetical protein